jgi:outer membrane cobalamin receptor
VAGNANLRPERSERFEVGIRQPFSLLNGSIGMTHFYTQVQNLIDFNTASFRLENLGRVESIGFEVDARAQPLESIEASAFASYANTVSDV